MRKYLCIYLPMWAINLAERRMARLAALRKETPKEKRAMLLVIKHANQIAVKRCCRIGLLSGVRPEMTLALAKALVPGAQVALFEPQRDFEMLQKLAAKLLNTSPLVAIDSVLALAAREERAAEVSSLFYGMVLDMTGTERWHAASSLDDEKIARGLMARFESAGIESQIAIAPTIGAAWALSRFGGERICVLKRGEFQRGTLQTEIKDSIAPLPVRALRVSEATCTALRQVGIARIGELLALPKKSLGLRFGIGLVRRIDQALGAVHEPLALVEERKEIACRQEFESPLTKHHELGIATLNALQQVLTRLAPRKEKPLALQITFESFGVVREVVTREIALLSGTTSQVQLQSIVLPIIEKIKFREGLRAVSIKVLHSERAQEKQVAFIKGTAPHEFSLIEEQRGELLNKLVTRFKKSAVNKVRFHDSYLPERSFSFEAVSPKKNDKDEKEHSPPPILKERPPYLLHTPEEIQAIAMLPDKPPSWIQWREEKLLVRLGVGPERIAGEWWSSAPDAEEGARDYFRVQDECGRWLWIYRDSRSLQWFVHGVWI